MKKFLLLGLAFMFLASCSEEKNIQMFKTSGNGLGTTYNISYFSTKEINLNPQIDSIFNVINSSLSTYIEDSDISRLNRGEDVQVDKHFIKVFNASVSIFEATNGYFDPSIGPLVNAYGFGPTKPLDTLDAALLDSLLLKVGLGKFKLANNTISTNVQGFYLDFNAIAKGYAVDVVADHLANLGLTNYFVELGGEIVAKGINLENNGPWRFGIEKPVENNNIRDLTHAISLTNKALATSGNYRKFRVDAESGERYVHTINPKTGKAERSNVLSASVVAEDCMTADAYATAFMAMGYENSLKVIGENKLSVLLIYVDENNDIQYYNTEDLNSQITEIE
jgi:thiamine biosynthesis lipoprotein